MSALLAAADAAVEVLAAERAERARPGRWSISARDSDVRSDLMAAMMLMGSTTVLVDLARWRGNLYAETLRLEGFDVRSSRAVDRGEVRPVLGYLFVHPEDIPELRGAIVGRRIARRAFGRRDGDPITVSEMLYRPERLDRSLRACEQARRVAAMMPVVTDPRSMLRYVSGGV